MPSKSDPAIDTDAIARLIDSGRCGDLVVIIGTGVSIALTNGTNSNLTWKGLIENGLAYGLERGKINADQAASYKAHLSSIDLDDLLTAAEFMGRKLDAPDGLLYARWLEKVFEHVTPINKEMERAIKAIRDLGIRLCTLNYDSLLEDVTTLPKINISETKKVVKWMLNGSSAGILHLHGSWEAPSTCILGIRDYESTLNDDVRGLIQRSLSSFKHLLFIGCGDTFADPNFSALIKWLNEKIKTGAPQHYALVREDEVAARHADQTWHGFVEPVSYGAGHNDLPAFILKLFPPLIKGDDLLANQSPIDIIDDSEIYDSDIFIGRKNQISEIEELLKSNRLITLVGLGGIGKTRLVKEIIKRKIEDAARKEAIAFVSFEYVTNDSEGEVLDTLVSRLKLAPANAEDRLQALVRLFKATPVLLVLDNCETSRTSIAKVVSPLLGRCRTLKIIATSQHQLGLKSEALCKLLPLSVPDDSPASLDSLEHFESYKLFINRVQMVDDTWIPGPDSAVSVRQLLQLTEGIPLAIEIVAAWAPFFSSLTDICNELAEKFLIMKKDEFSIDALGRHQSMFLCFEWSLGNLLPDEAAIFKRLGVFEGRFTIEAVHAVCEVDEPRKLLMHLVKKSLVHVCPGTDPLRYKLLNFTRAFAREKAKAEGLNQQLSKRHLDYYLSLIQPSADEVTGQDEVVVWWEEDWRDLLAAANAAPSIGDLQAVWQISYALGPFLQKRGLWSEREQLNRASVKAAEEANCWAALERSLINLGIVLEAQGRWEDAAEQYKKSLYYANRNSTRNSAH